jgi:hypothetical protein
MKSVQAEVEFEATLFFIQSKAHKPMKDDHRD